MGYQIWTRRGWAPVRPEPDIAALCFFAKEREEKAHAGRGTCDRLALAGLLRRARYWRHRPGGASVVSESLEAAAEYRARIAARERKSACP